MKALELEGDTLGKKHQYYNKLLKDAIDSKLRDPSHLNIEDNDIENILRIDLAHHYKDVEFILGVLKSEDMMYVARAISRSIWLITDPQYSHIINAEYLNSQVFPHMTFKARSKFIKRIQLNLKDEKRAEQFYAFEKNRIKAVQWLPLCSVPFIEDNVAKYPMAIKNRLLKRLCERSISILEVFVKNYQGILKSRLEATIFCLNVDAYKFLDLVESEEDYECPAFGKRTTKLAMKQVRDRIINQYGNYARYIHIPTFIDCLKRKNIKEFLYQQAIAQRKKESFGLRYYLFDSKHFGKFVGQIPEEERSQFIKNIFIDKIHSNVDLSTENPDSEIYKMATLYKVVQVDEHYFYQFLPYNTGFAHLRQSIAALSNSATKISMFTMLLHVAASDLQHMQKLTIYFAEKHANSNAKIKRQYLLDLFSHFIIYKNDEVIWKCINDIHQTMDNPKSDLNEKYKELFFIYNVINDKDMSQLVKIDFNIFNLKQYQDKLSLIESTKLFEYLMKHLWKTSAEKIEVENDLKMAVEATLNLLKLLSAWKKKLYDYPNILEKIKYLVSINKSNKWRVDMTSLYNVNKGWRILMIEESLILSPKEDTCLNALKHDPQMFISCKTEFQSICTSNSVSLQRFLRKLRTYYSQSMAKDLTEYYINVLENVSSHKAIVQGLCILLPREKLTSFILRYAPQEDKIDWKVNFPENSLQRIIAKYMHLARPQPSPDTVMLYAKGHYLHFALPSLLSVFYNLSPIKSKEQVMGIINKPVSLQKHGILYAFTRLSSEELMSIFSELWTATKSITIRCAVFKFTYRLICAEKDPERVKELWKLLALFIDNLSFDEDKSIYSLLCTGIKCVPITVRGQYLEKVYEFLKCFVLNKPGNDHYEWQIKNMVLYTNDIMEYMCPTFISKVLLHYINEHFQRSEFCHNIGLTPHIVSYILCTKDEQEQIRRYNEILKPIIFRTIDKWHEKYQRLYNKNLTKLLGWFPCELKRWVIEKNMIVPVKLFTEVQNELEKLPFAVFYVVSRKWTLSLEFLKLIQYNVVVGTEWDIICAEAAPAFAKICLEYMKNDAHNCFPCNYLQYSSIIGSILDIVAENVKLDIMELMLQDEGFVMVYLTVLLSIPENIENDDVNTRIEKLRKKMLEHPSLEVRMHAALKSHST